LPLWLKQSNSTWQLQESRWLKAALSVRRTAWCRR